MTLHSNQNVNHNKIITMTQKAMIKEHLRNGMTLTGDEANKLFGCSKASTRISEIIRDGETVYKRTIVVQTRFGEKRVTQYSMYKNFK